MSVALEEDERRARASGGAANEDVPSPSDGTPLTSSPEDLSEPSVVAVPAEVAVAGAT